MLVANLAGNQETIGVGTWTRIGGAGTGTITFGDANVYNTTATADAYGTYILQWEIVNGTCTTNDPVTINYAEAAAAGPDQDLCGVLVANLAGNQETIGVGTWTRIGGAGTGTITFGDANVYNTTATADAYGTYILQWEIVNGTCTTNDPVTINYAEAAAAGPDQDLCGVLVANLAGNQETIGVGTWTRIGGAGTGTITFGDANVYNTTATADAYGTYILQWEIVNGTCTTNDPVTINYAEAAAAGPDQDLCGVLVANLAGNQETIGVGTWTRIGGAGTGTITFGDANVYNTTATADAYGTYILQWEIVNGTCTTNDPVTINYAEAAAAGPDQDLCGVLVANLAGNQETIGVGTWTRIGGAGTGTITFGDANVYNTTATADAYGTYILQWEIVNGTCTTNDPVTINYAEAAAAGPDQDLCGVLVANLAGNQETIGVGTWTRIGGAGTGTITFGDANVYNTTATADAYGTYILQWEIVNGTCTTNDPVTINYAEAAAAGPDQDICGVLVANLAGNEETIGVGTWTRIGGAGTGTITFGDENFYNTTATADAYGTYILQWEIVNGTCTTNDPVTINYAEAAAAGPDQDLCGVLVANLAGNEETIGVGTWTRIGGAGTGTITFGDANVVQHDCHRGCLWHLYLTVGDRQWYVYDQ